MSQEPFDFSSTAESDFAPSHAYVSKKTKKEDVTSTAYTFTIVSVAGFILLILFGLDLLPFHSASYTKTLILIVMGVMFAIFFFIGIKSFMELKTLSNAADREEKQFEEICHWFLDTYTMLMPAFQTILTSRIIFCAMRSCAVCSLKNIRRQMPPS